MLNDYSSPLEGISQETQPSISSLEGIAVNTHQMAKSFGEISYLMKKQNRVKKATLVTLSAILATVVYIDYLIITSV